MFDLQPLKPAHPPRPAQAPCIAHGSDRNLHVGIESYCQRRSSFDPRFQRSKHAITMAWRTNHCVVDKDINDRVTGLSVPFKQSYISRMGPEHSVTTAVEVLFHHDDEWRRMEFTAEFVLSGQIPLLAQKYEDAMIYTVVRARHGYTKVLCDHGWHPFDPETELMLSRGQTGALPRCDELWFQLAQ